MKRGLLFLLSVFCAFGQQPKHVVLFSIDGGAAFHLDNQQLELPNIRALIAAGVWAESSETVFPSVTHPSHTTLITGVQPRKHGVLANEMPDKEGVLHPGNSGLRSEIILTKTIFDQAKAKGLSTASLYWPETVQDPAIDYNLIARVTPDGRIPPSGPWIEELQQHGIPIDLQASARGVGLSSSTGDDITTLVACDVIRNHKPGLLAVHLLSTDHDQHEFGPLHPLAGAALHNVDAQIGRIVKATKDAGIYEDTVFIVAADHGFTSVYWEINIRPMIAEAGLTGKIKFYEGGWAPFLRLTANFNKSADQPKLERLFERLRGNPNITHIYRSDEFPSLGLPRFEDSTRVRGQYLLVADPDTYLVEAADDSTALRLRKRPAHGHGNLPQSPKMYPMLVMAGPGLKKGTRIGHVHNADVAPTICRLLNLPPLDFDGRVLTEALTN